MINRRRAGDSVQVSGSLGLAGLGVIPRARQGALRSARVPQELITGVLAARRAAGPSARRACSAGTIMYWQAGARCQRAGRVAGRRALRAARVLRRYYHVSVSICIQPRGEPPGPGRRLVPRAEGPGGAKALRAPTFGSPGAASFPTLSARKVFSRGVVGQERPGRRGKTRGSPPCRRCLGRCWPTRPLFACPPLARTPRENQRADDLLSRYIFDFAG